MIGDVARANDNSNVMAKLWPSVPVTNRHSRRAQKLSETYFGGADRRELQHDK